MIDDCSPRCFFWSPPRLPDWCKHGSFGSILTRRYSAIGVGSPTRLVSKRLHPGHTSSASIIAPRPCHYRRGGSALPHSPPACWHSPWRGGGRRVEADPIAELRLTSIVALGESCDGLASAADPPTYLGQSRLGLASFEDKPAWSFGGSITCSGRADVRVASGGGCRVSHRLRSISDCVDNDSCCAVLAASRNTPYAQSPLTASLLRESCRSASHPILVIGGTARGA